MRPTFSAAFILGLLLASTELVSAHGDESHEAIARRREHMLHSRRQIEKCADKLRARHVAEARLNRRAELVEEHLAKRNLRKRSGFTLNPVLAKRDFSDVVDLPSLFPAQPECLLAPELTIGPYFAPEMLIRPDIREDQAGVEFLVALQLIDVNTCETVPDVMVDFWHCNSAGVYSHFAVEGTADETWNRGLQPSDNNGIVKITTNFPGWYQGRATHIHVATHINGQMTEGGFLANGTTTHIGQLFFPEDILTTFETIQPYSQNTVTRLLNAEDGIYNQQKSALGRDEVMDIHFIEEGNPSAGLVATLVMGIDLSANYSTSFSMGGGAPGGSGGPGGPQASREVSLVTTPTSSNGTNTANATASSGPSEQSGNSSPATYTLNKATSALGAVLLGAYHLVF